MKTARTLFIICASIFTIIIPQKIYAGGWGRHTIDATLTGADGIRLADVNEDGFQDIVTGWEESGIVKVYIHPGVRGVRKKWPSVVAGAAGSVEDALFVRFGGDETYHVLSACEGGTRCMHMHWAPKNSGLLLEETAWKTEAIPVTENKMQWMFAVSGCPDKGDGTILIAGGKNSDAQIGLLVPGENYRDLRSWTWFPLAAAGWVMSILTHDMDSDGDWDIVYTDRKGEASGCKWLENPGGEEILRKKWNVHYIGAEGREVMFMSIADLERDGNSEIIASVKPREIIIFKRVESRASAWREFSIAMPESAGTAKAVSAGDIDMDGNVDLVFSCEHASRKSGVMWVELNGLQRNGESTFHDISGQEGTKYDLIELLDLDGDGDLDVITCEESENLGVIWYENPAF